MALPRLECWAVGWLAILPHTDRLAWLLSQLRRPGRHR
jgi:hypothetical protein